MLKYLTCAHWSDLGSGVGTMVYALHKQAGNGDRNASLINAADSTVTGIVLN